jgi:glycine/D-amino acid oxidase-like deaminating enzyme
LPACPLVVDPTGVWFRPEGAGFLCGRSPGADEADPDEPGLEVDEAEFTAFMWPVLAGRVPAFEAVKVTGAWAGYYELNLFDANGVVGRHPDIGSLLFAAGFSGHGMQHAPAVGRGVAELIADGGYVTLDLSPLGIERVMAGKPLLERCVV